MKKVLFSLVAVLLFTVSGIAQTTFTKVTSASGLEAGANYLIVAHNDDLGVLAMGYQKANNRNAVVVDENGESITVTLGTDPSSETDVFQFTMGGSAGAWTLFDEVKGGYLYASSSSSNQLKTQTTLDDNGKWSITFNADGTAEVVAQGENERNNMRFNPNTSNNAPLFSCYAESSNIDTRVSFYKAGGGQIDPEPCEYPADFRVSGVDGVDVTLEWTDADCEGMNIKYLVIGSTGTITKPTDGVPVSDDLLHKNVGPDIEIVTFNGLTPNTHYNFAIFPYTNSGASIDYKTDGNYPTDDATTENIEAILFEDFDVELGVFTAYDAYGDQSWQHGEYQGTTYAYMNGYADGAAHQNEDWLISPAIEIGADEWEEITFEFRSAWKYEGNSIQVFVSSDYDGVSEPGGGDFEWIEITDAFDYSPGNYEWAESGQYVMIQPEAGRYYFAFLYTSTNEAASAWEIDYVKIMGRKFVSVDENNKQMVSFYPNPASEQVTFTLESDAQVSVFDMMGRKVNETECKAGQAQLNVNELESGVYFVNIRFANGSTAVSKFVKF